MDIRRFNQSKGDNYCKENNRYILIHDLSIEEFYIIPCTGGRIPVVEIDPAYTIQECPVCRNTDKRNRYTRVNFKCINCGHTDKADYVASLNIKPRVAVNPPIVEGIIYRHLICPTASSNALVLGS